MAVRKSIFITSGYRANDVQFSNEQLDILLDSLQAEVVPLDRSIAELARQAFRRFGRGRHKAKLNFGDCMSYATAKHLRLPLLYKGEDFGQTDICLRSSFSRKNPEQGLTTNYAMFVAEQSKGRGRRENYGSQVLVEKISAGPKAHLPLVYQEILASRTFVGK